MADQKSVDQLREIVTDCTDTPIDEFVSKAEWGAINFDLARPHIEQVFRILAPFGDLPIEGLPQNIVAAITSAATPVQETLKQIKDFNLDVENPSGHRDQLTTQLSTQTEQLSTGHALDTVFGI